jgi:aminopeptidase-like protein
MGGLSPPDYQMALLWVLNMSDGHNSLLDIGQKSKLPWAMVKQAAAALTEAGLLRPIEPELAPEGRIPGLAGTA